MILILTFGLIFHVYYLRSMFDVYYQPQLINGQNLVPNMIEAKGPKRLFVFLSDGLRADTFFDPENTKYLRSLREKGQAAFGISQAKVPTESRPGHVSILSGYSEDMSLVTKRWEIESLEYDHLMNRTSFSWMCGEDHMINLFKIEEDQVLVDVSQQKKIGFDGDLSFYDQFCFQSMNQFLQNPKFEKYLEQDQALFFLDLQSADSKGHKYGPHSHQYNDNLKSLDENIELLVQKISSITGDNDSAFLITSDHGMSESSNHGDGNLNVTRTPFMLWGAGVRRSSEFHEVQQNDLCPLMASLLRLEIPTSNQGMTPIELLELKPRDELLALLTNAHQFLENLRVVEERAQSSRLWLWKTEPTAEQFSAQLSRMSQLAKAQSPNLNTQDILQLMHQIQISTQYYFDYDKPLLQFLSALGYLGWIALSAVIISTETEPPKQESERTGSRYLLAGKVLLNLLLGGALLYFVLNSFSASYYRYLIFPGVFLQLLLAFFRNLNFDAILQRKRIINLAIFFVALVSLASTFYERTTLTYLLIIVSGLQFFSRGEHRSIDDWVFSGLLLVCSVFPQLKNGNVYSLFDIFVGIAANFGFMVYLYQKHRKSLGPQLYLSSALWLISIFVMYSSDQILEQNALSKGGENQVPVPFTNILFAWFALLWTFPSLVYICFWCREDDLTTRLIRIYLSIIAGFQMLCASFEVTFYLAFLFTVIYWLKVEQRTNALAELGDSASNPYFLRTAFFFTLFLYTGYFGQGNTVSTNSFQFVTLLRFIQVLNLPVMGSLFFYKFMAPGFLLSTAIGILSRRVVHQNISLLLIYILSASSDVLVLIYFFDIRTEGSWADIGMSIARFVIATVHTLFYTIFLIISKYLSRGVKVEELEK